MVTVAGTLISATLYVILCPFTEAFVVSHFPIDQSILELSHDCSMRLGAYGQGKRRQIFNKIVLCAAVNQPNIRFIVNKVSWYNVVKASIKSTHLCIISNEGFFCRRC